MKEFWEQYKVVVFGLGGTVALITAIGTISLTIILWPGKVKTELGFLRIKDKEIQKEIQRVQINQEKCCDEMKNEIDKRVKLEKLQDKLVPIQNDITHVKENVDRIAKQIEKLYDRFINDK